MADFTSTVTISGKIGSRTINFTHTYTIENVYDIGQASGSFSTQTGLPASSLTLGSGNAYTIYSQDVPNYIFAKNSEVATPVGITITQNSGPTSITFVLLANQFIILVAGSGMFNVAATGTVTLKDVDEVHVNRCVGFVTGTAQVLTAFNAVT